MAGSFADDRRAQRKKALMVAVPAALVVVLIAALLLLGRGGDGGGGPRDAEGLQADDTSTTAEVASSLASTAPSLGDITSTSTVVPGPSTTPVLPIATTTTVTTPPPPPSTTTTRGPVELSLVGKITLQEGIGCPGSQNFKTGWYVLVIDAGSASSVPVGQGNIGSCAASGSVTTWSYTARVSGESRKPRGYRIQVPKQSGGSTTDGCISEKVANDPGPTAGEVRDANATFPASCRG